MFGKNKTYTVDEILCFIAALPDEERKKVQKAIAFNVPAPEEGGGETPTPEEKPTEAPAASEEKPAEETKNDEDPAPPEENDAEGEDPPKDLAPEEGTHENEAMQALAARVESLEQKLENLIMKQTEAVKAEENKDFGDYPSAPDAPAEGDERYDAVMRSYAGRNANKY